MIRLSRVSRNGCLDGSRGHPAYSRKKMAIKMEPLALAVVIAMNCNPVVAEMTLTTPMYRTTEIPAYTVERRDGAVEIRQYPARIVAEVALPGSRKDAISAGFRLLARYIFGGNSAKGKVAMTAPVAQSPSHEIAMTAPVSQTAVNGTWTVQFTMPSSYTLESLPKPDAPRVGLLSQPADRQLVLQFSGLTGAGTLAAKETAVRDWAKAQGMILGAGPHYYCYDDPFTLPWNRRNEVAFTLT